MIRFDDLIGQEPASSVLRKAVREDKITHAYLFTGPEGTGKLTAALAFAAAMNCESRKDTGDSCGTCAQCRMFDEDRHPDVDIIKPDKGVTKIGMMQDMLKASWFAPVKGRRKVVIIEQADTLNDDSSNCILKVLEEAPEYLVIILLSRNPVLLLPTIRSRCLQVRFIPVPRELLATLLSERYVISISEAEFLAAYSQGCPGKAISCLQDEDFKAQRNKVTDLTIDMISADRRSVLKYTEKLQSLAVTDEENGEGNRGRLQSVLQMLILLYRDLLNLSVRGQSAELINSDLRDRLAAVNMDSARALESIETLLWARRAIEGNANIQLVVGVMMIRLMSRKIPEIARV